MTRLYYKYLVEKGWEICQAWEENQFVTLRRNYVVWWQHLSYLLFLLVSAEEMVLSRYFVYQGLTQEISEFL